MWRKALSLRREWVQDQRAHPATLPSAATIDDSQLSFSLPSVSCKKVAAVFDGGRLSSDGGVMVLALVERRRNVAATLAALIADGVKWLAEPSLIQMECIAAATFKRALTVWRIERRDALCGYPVGDKRA